MSNRELNVMQINEWTLRFDFGPMNRDETFSIVQEFCGFIEREWKGLVEEVVPSYETVTVYFQRELLNSMAFIDDIQLKWQAKTNQELKMIRRQIQIPVCYEEVFSEDLSYVMEHTRLSREEVISLHTSPNYTVFAIGFLPGFPYLGGLPPELAVPRRSKPRLVVPKGAVGIGGTQTGIYPIESPGGWHLIGRTPLDLYDPNRSQPFLLQTGDSITFHPISTKQFDEIQAQITGNSDMYSNYVKEVTV